MSEEARWCTTPLTDQIRGVAEQFAIATILICELLPVLVIPEIELVLGNEFEQVFPLHRTLCGGRESSGFARLRLRHGIHGVANAVGIDRRGVQIAIVVVDIGGSWVGHATAVDLGDGVLSFGVHHGRHELGVEGRVPKLGGDAVGAPRFLAGVGHVFGVDEGSFVVEIGLVVEGAGTIDLEADEEDGEGSEDGDLDPGAVGFDCAGHDDVREDGGEDHAIEEDAPELTARFIFGDEDVEEKILLEPVVDSEVESCNRDDEGLDCREAKGDRCVEEEVVVIYSVVECQGRGKLDQLARRGRGEFLAIPYPEELDHLGKISSTTEVSLEEP